MEPSFRAFMAGLIDYAGLFPPASLPLDEAVRSFAAYRRGPDGWMLPRFICPAGRLRELGPYRMLLEREGPFTFSVLAGAGEDPEAFGARFDSELASVRAFLKEHGANARVEAIEAKLPPRLVEAADAAALRELVAGAARSVDAKLSVAAAIFVEPVLPPEWRRAIAAVASVLRVVGRSRRERAPADQVPIVGLKLRCGGAEPRAFPTSEQVAAVIGLCRDEGVPFKATAGLHHPVRRIDPSAGAMSHGFLNVFGAAILAHARGLGETELRQVIEDEEPAHFIFAGDRFAWHDYPAKTEEITRIRAAAVISFGSCSFDEPRDDLRRLGLLVAR